MYGKRYVLSTNQTKTNPYWLIDSLFIVITLGIFYALWIGGHPLFTPDEGRYSEVAREMLASNDFVTPRLNGVAFLDKPALYYWLQASAIYLFGLKEWALRFWPAFMGVLGSLVVYLAGTTLFNRRTGILSALILATCPLYYGAAHYANLDLEVAVLISNSLLFFIIATYLPISFHRSASLITAYTFAGLAFLTKGLIGIAFPGMIIGAWILLLNRWAILKKMHLIAGMILFLAITIPWYVLAQKANPEFLHFFFVTQQVSRFLTKGHFNNQAAFWFYFPIVLAGIFPWAIFAIQAIVTQAKQTWKNRQENAGRLFLLLWLVIIFTFFSIPKSKTVGYILPIFPALALLIGNYIDLIWDKAKSTRINISVIAFIILCVGIAAGFFAAPLIHKLRITPNLIPYLYTDAIVLTVAAIAAVYLLKRKSFTGIFYCLLITGSLFLITLTAASSAINQRSIKPLIMELNTVLKPDDEVVTYYKFYYDLPIYAQRRITVVADWKAPDIIQNDNWLREMWFGMPFQNTSEWLIDKNTFEQRWNSNRRLFVLTDMNYYADMKASLKGNIYEIARYKNTVLLSNSPQA